MGWQIMKNRNIRLRTGLIATLIVTVMTVTIGAAAFGFAASDFGMENMFPFISKQELTYITPTAKIALTEATAGQIIMETDSRSCDLAIMVRHPNGLLAEGYSFEFTINRMGDEKFSLNAIDDDMDGLVYIDDLDAGEYRIEMLPFKGVQLPEPVIAEVVSDTSYTPIDVKDKVKTPDQIDQSQDDPKYQNKVNNNGGDPPPPPPSTDTVEYIESYTEVETIIEETPVLDENGKQVIKYKPTLADGGYLIWDDGKVSDILAVLDAEGYIIGARRKGANNPDGSPQYTDCTSEVLSSTGEPLKKGDRYLFKMEKVPQVIITEKVITHYYGWQVIDGKTYYFDKDGNYVTGKQIIQGIEYFFSDTGVRGGSIGIDVSTWQDNIDWKKVKEAGIEFAFIRLGFRGYVTGSLVLDNCYHRNMAGAIAAGVRVGVYFFSQAITEREAIEEASMCLEYVKGYKLSLPIAIDIESAESSLARTNSLTADQLTKIAIAFCETIRYGGYTPCVYANKYYLTSKMYASRLSSYVIWLAHYTEKTDYANRFDIWQHTSTGRVNGIKGNVDMNYSYIF